MLNPILKNVEGDRCFTFLNAVRYNIQNFAYKIS